MTSVEKVLNVLKERHIAVSRMERDLGFSNGYIRQLKKGTMPIERLVSVADYLDLSINDLLSDGQPHLLEMKEAATSDGDGLSDKESTQFPSNKKHPRVIIGSGAFRLLA